MEIPEDIQLLMDNATRHQEELNRKRHRKKEIESTPDYQEMIHNGDIDSISVFLKKYPEYEYIGDEIKSLDALVQKENKSFSDYLRERELIEEKEKIKKSGLTETNWRFKQAVREFGYTDDPRYGGYILPNGRMLNFGRSMQGSREEDHAGIGRIFADYDIVGSKAVNEFKKLGAIRMQYGEKPPGFLDLFAECVLTHEQMTAIRRLGACGKTYYIDFTDADNHVVWCTKEPTDNPLGQILDFLGR